MKYIKVCYMCPICAQGYFFDKSSQFSTECPKCHVEMVCVEEKNTTTEIEERESRRWENGKSAILIECPYCHSMNTSKIGTVSRMTSTAMFGLASKKIGKQWHCNNCKSDF